MNYNPGKEKKKKELKSMHIYSPNFYSENLYKEIISVFFFSNKNYDKFYKAFVILTTSLSDRQACIIVNRFYVLTFIVAAMTSFGALSTAFLWLLCTFIRNNTGLRPQLHLKSKHCFDLTSGYSKSDSRESLSSVKHNVMLRSVLLLSQCRTNCL
jgi:hypothetical protein